MKAATIVVVGTFAEGYEGYFAEYSSKIRAYLETQGATVIRRQRVERTLYGDARPSLVMLIDFQSKERAEAAFFEPEYLALIPLRNKIFAHFHMFLAESGEIF